MPWAAVDVDDLKFMRAALELARRAEEQGEVPVGAVVVRDGDIIGRGRNRTIGLHDPSGHAEILALREAGESTGNYRLPGCALYVSLEPCAMCAGAIIHARLQRVIYAASDPKTGADGGCFELLRSPLHNHRPEVQPGLLADEASKLMVQFFRGRRQKS